MAICRKYRLSVADSEDIVQEVFLSILRNEKYQNGQIAKPKAYVANCIFHEAEKHFRNKIRERKLMAIVAEAQDVLQTDETVGLLDLQQELEIALKQLTVDQQQVIKMWMNCTPYREIAEELDTNEDSVRGLIFRAKASLRKSLKSKKTTK